MLPRRCDVGRVVLVNEAQQRRSRAMVAGAAPRRGRELVRDPLVGAAHALLERDGRLPAQHRAQPRVVAGTAPDTQRAR